MFTNQSPYRFDTISTKTVITLFVEASFESIDVQVRWYRNTSNCNTRKWSCSHNTKNSYVTMNKIWNF